MGSERARRELRLTPEEMAVIILAGECYENDKDFIATYGFNPKGWPHRSVLLKRTKGRGWGTWDKQHGWVTW